MCACSAIGIGNGTAEAGVLRDGTTGRVALPQAQPSMSADRVWTGHHSALPLGLGHRFAVPVVPPRSLRTRRSKKDNFVQVKRISIYTHLCDLFSRRPFFEVRRKIDIGTLCGLASIHTICCIVKHTQHCVLLHVHKHCLGHLTDAIYADSDGEATGLV